MARASIVFGITGLLALALAGAWVVTDVRPPMTLLGTPPPSTTPQPPPANPWGRAELDELVGAVRSADREGLQASDYKLPELEAAITSGRAGPAVDKVATAAALALAHDYAAGRIRNQHRFNWYVDYAGPDPAAMARQLAAARADGRLGPWLADLLPTNPAYRALRAALAEAPADDGEQRDRIIANMERWRWLPRDFGAGDQLYVNLPTYQLEVVTGGKVTDTYRAVIGATDMPTPVLSAPVRQVIANPDWIVPASIVRRSHLRPGSSSRYIFSRRPDGTLRVRQKPGPANALGRVKIEFPNRLAIYFHDTPSRSLFGASTRAFSHGCVRVQNIEVLASSIVARPDRFASSLAGVKTRSFKPARSWTANIVYLTLAPAADGTLSYVGDPYHMDEPLAAALQGRKPRRPPPAPHLPMASPVPVESPVAVEPQPTLTPSPEPIITTPVEPLPDRNDASEEMSNQQ